MTETISFSGRTAVITGAGSGLGRAYAHELATRGARVVVNDLPGSTAADTVVAEILAAGGDALVCHGDVSVPEDMERLIGTAVSTSGRLDILINNAGGGASPMFASPDDWDRALKINLLGVVNTLRAAWPHFEKQDFGRVVNTSSSSFLGTPFAGSYAAAKAGVVGLTKVLASTYPDTNIKINAIMPVAGTPMTAQNPNQVMRDWMQNHFQPEKAAAFVPVLCRDTLDVNGETFLIGGGRAARVLFETTAGWFDAEPTAEGYLEHFADVMAGEDARFATSGAGDLIRYVDLLGDRGPF